MKRLTLLAILSIVILSSCEITVYDEHPVIIDERDKFLGSYQMEEFSDTYDMYSNFNIYISKSPYDVDILFISNFYASDIEVIAIVQGDRLVLPLQEVNAYEIEGEGRYRGGEISFDYVVRDLTRHHIINDYCSAIAF